MEQSIKDDVEVWGSKDEINGTKKIARRNERIKNVDILLEEKEKEKEEMSRDIERMVKKSIRE